MRWRSKIAAVMKAVIIKEEDWLLMMSDIVLLYKLGLKESRSEICL